MLGRALAFATSRLAGRAVDQIERRVVWTGVAVAFFAGALVFALIATFLWLDSLMGTAAAAAIVGIGCAVIGAIGISMPTMIEKVEEASSEGEKSTAERVGEAAQHDIDEAVDMLGPLQVAASAFMLGLSAGRRVRGRA